MLITVFTPTYNRAHLLPRLYESLKAQTFQDFEWIIVDDGSTDNTETVVKEWIQPEGNRNNFHPLGGIKGGFRYFMQPNGGKHRAINRGAQEARGELFFIADSDDYMPKDSLEKVAKKYEKVKDDKTIGGICGLDITPHGNVIGSGLPCDEIICTSLDLRVKHHVTGDLKEVFYTHVMCEFPFPEFNGERFCPEALVWNRIAQKYNLLFFNEPIYIADYQVEGITAGIVRVRMNSPVASATTYQELNSYNIPIKEKIKAAINYWRFRACVAKDKRVPNLPWYWFWCKPIGYLMHIRDKQ
jgi:glycosyltransferase involved in cell wall biosynthesis